MVSSEESPHLNELVAKINRSFVMAPVVTPISLVTPGTAEGPEEVSSMEVEIPFTPASQRPTKVLKEEEQDTIVVVGQARQKRKRPKAGVDGAEGASGSTVGGKMKKTRVKKETEAKDDIDEDRAAAFDFSSVPNILDDNPNVEEKKKKRKKGKKGKRKTFFFPLNIIHLSKC